MTAAAPPPSPAAPWVVLLSVWAGPDGGSAGWHARVVWPDSHSREFDSPFELAQFLGRPPRWPADAGPKAGGLR